MPVLLRPLPTTLSWLDDDRECEEFAKSLIQRLGFKDFALSFGRYPLDWHVPAMAVTRFEAYQGAILVNQKTWPMATGLFRYRALIHEACHTASIFMLSGHSVAEREAWLGPTGHGPLWVSLMQTFGCPPDFRHNRRFYYREDVMAAIFPRRPHRADCWACNGAFALSIGMTHQPRWCPACDASVLQLRDLPQPDGQPIRYRYP